MLKCPTCNFEFTITYPMWKDLYKDRCFEYVYCPICKAEVIGVPKTHITLE